MLRRCRWCGVTGSSGVGKSTVCALLKSRGESAVDADWEGYNHWVDRTSGQVVVDPPDPVPAGWLDRFAWKIIRAEVEALAAGTHDETTFLCGTVENEEDVWDLFDRVESTHRRLGATIIDGVRPPAEVADAILAAAGRTSQRAVADDIR